MAANIAGGVDLGDTFSRLGPILDVRVLAKDERNVFEIISFSCLLDAEYLFLTSTILPFPHCCFT